jgi:uncharacterized protein YceK
MKKYLLAKLVGSVLVIALLFGCGSVTVPQTVKDSFSQKYPQAKKVSWESENGNYEANWGGKDGEANSVTYTPSGTFVEIVKEIPESQLPASVHSYIQEHFKSAKFGDVGKVLDAQGKTSYEVEINGKDVIFDENGNFVKEEK